MIEKPSCSTCDFMRRINGSMRCLFNPPVPVLIGAIPAKIQGAPPIPVVTGMLPELTAEVFCRHHPLLRPEGEVTQSPGMAEAAVDRHPDLDVTTHGGIILPPEATKQ